MSRSVRRSRAVGGGTVSELTVDQSPVLGYSIVQAESIEEAVELLAECPMDMWAYNTGSCLPAAHNVILRV